MRHEANFEGLVPILEQRRVCIRPNGTNNLRAKLDFDSGKVRYYSFGFADPTTEPQRGYFRLVQEPSIHALVLDFMSPYSEQKGWEALVHLAAKTQKIAEILVPWDNSPQLMKAHMVEKGRMNLGEMFAGMHHRVYTFGEKNMYTLVPEGVLNA